MIVYLGMLAIPALLALYGAKRPAWITLVGIIYWLIIGFRFEVGMDWPNYVQIYSESRRNSFLEAATAREPGFTLLMWLAESTGGGILLVNAVAAFVFCLGFFTFAYRCKEPFLAVVVATPLLVIAFAMTSVRQSIAIGILCYLYAKWDNYGLIKRVMVVFLACLFHFSAAFILMFVALSARVQPVTRIAAAVLIGGLIVGVTIFAPSSVEAYSRLYGGNRPITAPGALAHTSVIALASVSYFAVRATWHARYGWNRLYGNLAVASFLSVPAVFLSSVGAYRFALYFWPFAMYIAAGLPGLITSPAGRRLCRGLIVSGSFVLLGVWLSFANNSFAWFPYTNWLWLDAINR